MIYLAADHRGISHKALLIHHLQDKGHEIFDVGAWELNKSDDYVDFARAALEKIVVDPVNNKGIFLCGSGHGMDLVANKYRGVRAALGFNADVAKQSRGHEDTNVLIIAADWTSEEETKKIASSWLETPFSGEERHVRRLKKIEDIEEKNFK